LVVEARAQLLWCDRVVAIPVAAVLFDRIDHRPEPNRVEPLDRFIDQGRREMGRFGIGHCITAIGVQQHFVQAMQHAANLQQPCALGFDRLLE
jgi:hypothetical protein